MGSSSTMPSEKPRDGFTNLSFGTRRTEMPCYLEATVSISAVEFGQFFALTYSESVGSRCW
jgi:hypothetical protein